MGSGGDAPGWGTQATPEQHREYLAKQAEKKMPTKEQYSTGFGTEEQNAATPYEEAARKAEAAGKPLTPAEHQAWKVHNDREADREALEKAEAGRRARRHAEQTGQPDPDPSAKWGMW